MRFGDHSPCGLTHAGALADTLSGRVVRIADGHYHALMFKFACSLYHEFCGNPDLSASRLALLRNVLTDLGLTPPSRQRMPIPVEDDAW